MIATNEFGQILAIQGKDGKNILFPHCKVGEKNRGGAFAIAPVFGCVPATQVWKGVNLPKHGFLRETAAEHFAGHSVDEFGNQNYEFHFHSSKEYPWGFSSIISHRELPEPKDLFSGIFSFKHTHTKDNASGGMRLMPISHGWHPYFSMDGDINFTVEVDGKVVPLGDDVSIPVILPLDVTSLIVLTTARRQVTIKTMQFTEVVLWSDNLRKRICIEPVQGLRNPVLLFPGQSTNPWCQVDVK